MKAIVYEKYGPPEVLQIRAVEKPVPKDNEVLVKVFATPITVGDVRLRKADPFMARTFNGLIKPKRNILGMNFAGRIEATGRNVKQFKSGDTVFGSTVFAFGCYAEYLTIPEEGVITKMPSDTSYEEAAVIPFGSLTSLHFLRKGNIKEGQKVLIYGASGSLGTAAIQLAKYFGTEVTGVCSTANLELVKSLGANHVIDYTKENFAHHDQTYDIIYDTVGKSPFFDSVRKLNKNGIYLNAVHIPPFSIFKNIWITLTSSKKIIGGISIESKEGLDFIKKLIEEGKYKPVIDRRYPFEQIVDAHRYVDQGHKKGNVVITLNQSNKI
jgi:NADPH:quinone reductase-like Zn-dependent oxidoreductase